ncbi:uncharacterized protein LOC121833105 [Ixodes scapularis]|uniref:uncharacterized protein LOC121833105 n=1 Tax=Ixodes scapularis TaxID=6945 RepID=UPI001C391EF2|nr:uncharacterized protein LOC121833105 [Ixodes scapularis]
MEAHYAVLNRKQFNGFYGCSWCFQKGPLVEGIVKNPFKKDGMLEHTHKTVLQPMKAAVRQSKSAVVYCTKGLSPVAVLRALDMVWGVSPDYMHCVLEGVVPQMMELWLSAKGTAWYIGSSVRDLDSW